MIFSSMFRMLLLSVLILKSMTILTIYEVTLSLGIAKLSIKQKKIKASKMN